MFNMPISVGWTSFTRLRQNTKKGNAKTYHIVHTSLIVNFVHDKEPLILEETRSIGIMPEMTQCSQQSMSSQGMKTLSYTTTKQKPPTVPKEKKEKKSGKGKQKAKELETISEAVLTETEQLKIITKRSRKETHSSHASGSGADEGTGFTPGMTKTVNNEDGRDGCCKGTQSDDDDTYVEDQGNEVVEDTNANLEGRDDVMTDAILPQFDAYEADKILLDTYGDTVTIKRPRDGADDDQEPSAGIRRGPKEEGQEKNPLLPYASSETTTTTARKTTNYSSKTHKQSSRPIGSGRVNYETTDSFEAPAHQEFETCVHDEQHKKRNNPEGRQYPHDLRQPLPLVPNSQGRHVIPFHHFINNDLEYLRGGESSRKYSTSVTKTMAADYGHIKWIEDLVPTSCRSRMQNYKHLTRFTSRRDDDVFYKFKEGDFHRLRIQDIEDMLLLLVQGKVTNLNVEEPIKKKLNLTNLTLQSNLRRLRRFIHHKAPKSKVYIYENKDKKNRLMRIDELHKFSDGTLDDVRTALKYGSPQGM
ncbi:hypothetical protein Tco_0547815 [Tanacetum coccineum]